MDRRVLAAVLAGLFLPYAGALAVTGTARGETASALSQEAAEDEKRIVIEREEGRFSLSVEEYLPLVLARQIPIEYEMEALKAQAVIARTYLYRQLEAAGGEEIAEEALDLDIFEEEQLVRLWGSSAFPAYYERLEEVAAQTEGLAMTYEGHYIEPLFCRLTAGSTRDGSEIGPYLAPVDCAADREAAGSETSFSFTAGEIEAALSQLRPATVAESFSRPKGRLGESVQIVERDAAGYVKEVQLAGQVYTGEEFQYALGLPSAAFSIEPQGEGIRVTVGGQGHGYGLSQHTANELAAEGFPAADILRYFYKNIELTSE